MNAGESPTGTAETPHAPPGVAPVLSTEAMPPLSTATAAKSEAERRRELGQENAPTHAPGAPAVATSQLKPRAGRTFAGTLSLSDTAQGARLLVSARNAAPGRYMVLLHSVASCHDLEHETARPIGAPEDTVESLGELRIDRNGEGHLDTTILRVIIPGGVGAMDQKSVALHELFGVDSRLGPPVGNNAPIPRTGYEPRESSGYPPGTSARLPTGSGSSISNTSGWSTQLSPPDRGPATPPKVPPLTAITGPSIACGVLQVQKAEPPRG
jgi:hypothetical protein